MSNDFVDFGFGIMLCAAAILLIILGGVILRETGSDKSKKYEAINKCIELTQSVTDCHLIFK